MIIWEILANKWFVLLLSVGFMMIGLLPELTMKVVRITGKMGWAENRFGEGGTFTVWKWIGILAPLLAIIYFFSGGYSPSKGWLNQSQDKVNQVEDVYESYY